MGGTSLIVISNRLTFFRSTNLLLLNYNFFCKVQLMKTVRPYESRDMKTSLDIFDDNTTRFFSPVEREDFKRLSRNYSVVWNYLVIEDEGSIVAWGGNNCDNAPKSASFCCGMVANNLRGTGLGKLIIKAKLNTPSTMRGIEKIRLNKYQTTQSF